MAASEGMWLHLPPDKALQPRPVRLTGAAAAMEWAIAEVHGGKKRASKDRVDLAALAAHCGTSYVQTETVPKALFESVRETQANVVALVLLPPGAGASSVAGGDAVVLFYDATGPLKGLPPNGRADMLAAASGLAGRKFYGEAVLARLVHGTESLSLGGETSGQFMVERDWLEAAQAANKAAGAAANATSAFAELLTTSLAEGRKRAIAAAIAAAAAAEAAAVVAAEAAAVEAANPTPAAPQKPAVAVGHDPNMALSRRAVEAEVAGQVGRHDAVEAESGVGELVFADEKGEVTVTVRVPAATKAKHVRCVVKEQHLTLEVSTLPAGQTLVVNGELFQKVDVDGCNWMVEDDKAKGRLLQLTLTKAVQMTWLMLVRS